MLFQSYQSPFVSVTQGCHFYCFAITFLFQRAPCFMSLPSISPRRGLAHQVRKPFPAVRQLRGFFDPTTVLRQSFDEIRKNSSSFHRADHTLDKDNLVLCQAVFLIQHLVCPRVGEVLHGDELIDLCRCHL